MWGYKGLIAEIDLSTRKINKITLEEEILRRYIGGSGLAAKLFLDQVNSDVNPLSDGNNLYIMTGPLTGTKLPGTGRFSVAAKSPLTNMWGESNCGGNFGPELKFAGYDGIIVKGISDKPVYIFIDDGNISICECPELWGKDTYTVTEFFKKTLSGQKKVKVFAIGQAGENLVKYASIVNDKGDLAGRCGLGAVMGYKKLKAVVTRGTSRVIPSFLQEYEQLAKSTMEKVKKVPMAIGLKTLGTDGGMIVGRKTGDVPTKNWTIGDSIEFTKPLRPYVINEKYLVRGHACYSCPIGCKRVVKVDEGVYQTKEGPGPEYETYGSFGTLLLIKDPEAIIKINETCNQYGLDTITCGSTIAFAIDCFENGLITKKDTDGIELRWGEPDSVLKIIEKIVKGEGFGNLLKEGSREAQKKIGKNSADYLVDVKGLEMPMHDPRSFHGIGLAYATSNRGACHLQHMVHFVETDMTSYPEIGLDGGYDRLEDEGKAEMTINCEDLGMVVGAVTICIFVMSCLSVNDLIDMMRVTTGFNYNLKEIMECGERLWYLKRAINNNMNIRASDDRLPKKVMIPFKDGSPTGSVPNMELMLRRYYQLRDLDKNGIPTRDKMENLGLLDLFPELYNL